MSRLKESWSRSMAYSLTAIAALCFVAAQPLRAEIVAWPGGTPSFISNLVDVVAVSAGAASSALRRNGSVVGFSNGGQLFQAPPDLTNAVSIAPGFFSLLNDGTVTNWVPSSSFTPPYHLTNIVAIAGADVFGLALLSNGSVAPAWGNPLSIPALTNAVAIAAGSGFGLALKADGTVVSFSYYSSSLIEGISNVVGISAGYDHSLALQADGRVRAWGNNSSGQCDVPSGLSNVVGIAAGNAYSLALRSDGTISAWGYQASQLPEDLSNVVAISASLYNVPIYSLALIGEGSPFITSQPISAATYSGQPVLLRASASGAAPLYYQWRHNGTNVPSATNAFLFLPSPQTSDSGSYALTVRNTLGTAGSLKATLTISDSPPLVQVPMTNQMAYIGKLIAFQPSVVGSGPLIYRWQHNGVDLGQALEPSLILGSAKMSDSGQYSMTASNRLGVVTNSAALVVSEAVSLSRSSPPEEVYPPIHSNVVSITSLGVTNGLWHAALRGDGGVRAWDSADEPVEIPASFTNLLAIAGGNARLIGLRVDGTIVAVHASTNLPLVFESDFAVPAGSSNIISIAGGPDTGLGLRVDGACVAWGTLYGILGFAVPADPPPGLSNVTGIDINTDHALAVRQDGTVVAWGTDNEGQTNVPVNLSNVVDVAAPSNLSLALLQDDTVVSWGGHNGVCPPPHFTNVEALIKGSRSVVLKDSTVASSGCFDPVPPGLTNVCQVCAAADVWFIAGDIAPFLRMRPMDTVAGGGADAALRAHAIGSAPMSYQWKLNGRDLASATNASLLLTNVQSANAGNYTVAVSNAFGVATASATLTVTGTPPVVTSQPLDRSTETGESATFSVVANGYQPFQYQWQLNGTALAGATNPVLVLNNLTGTNSGSYRVVVSNAFGVAFSSNAVLTVRIPLAEALDTTGVVWSTSGDASWFGQPWITHDGIDAGQTGHISDSQQSVLETFYVGPAIVTFWWKVSSEPFWDNLSFSIGGPIYTNISGEVDWQQQSFTIPAGLQRLQWVYAKDPSASGGQDAGWLDRVSFTGGSFPPILATPTLTGSRFSASISTISGKTYSLEYKNSLIDPTWTPVATLQGDGTIQTLSDTNGVVLQRFYRVSRSN